MTTFGMAQQLFMQRYGALPWKMDRHEDSWAALRQWYSTVDVAVAQALTRNMDSPTLAQMTLLCHLSAAVQQGHLCVSITKNEVNPSPETLGLVNAQIVTEWLLQIEETIPPPTCIKQQQRYYLPRYWMAESTVLQHFIRLVETKPTPFIDEARISTQSLGLQPAQEQAVRCACNQSVTLLTGGPGTGKTYTAGKIIQSLWSALPPEERAHFTVVLAAPTGKAAANLEACLSKKGEGPSCRGQTLHSLLSIKAKAHRSSSAAALAADLIIVDECSMMDVELMGQLLGSIRAGARLVLLGDANQLPAVESGGVYADLVRACTNRPLLVELTHCQRTESRHILDFAQAVRKGDAKACMASLQAGQDLMRIDLPSISELVSLYPIPKQDTADAVAQAIRSFRILSPIRKGPWGVETLNELCAQHARATCAQAMPILIIANDHKQELYNGDLGWLYMTHEPYALFLQRNQLRRIPHHRLPRYEYAYCLSVHKSQGSEFHHVLLLVPEGSEKFSRELLYTAATRAKTKLQVCGADEAIEQLIQRTAIRFSGIAERLRKSPDHVNSMTYSPA